MAARKKASPPVEVAPNRGNLLLLILLVGMIFYCSWVNNRVVIRGYELSKLRQREKQLLDEQEKLRTELATLLRPQNLARLARRLGLKPPAPGHKVIMP